MAKSEKDDMARALEAMFNGPADAEARTHEPAIEDVPPVQPPMAKPKAVASPPPVSPTSVTEPPVAKPRAESPSRPATPAPNASGSDKPAAKRPDKPASYRPATPQAALASKATHRSATQSPATLPIYKRLSFRQTIIPPMLTLGVVLPIFGLLPLVVSDESPWAAISPAVAITFILLGILMAGLGVVTMLMVKQQLAENSAEPAVERG